MEVCKYAKTRDETSDFAWGGAKNEHGFLEETDVQPGREEIGDLG